MLSLDWTPDDGGAPQSIDIDCAVTVTFECASEVTDHPVETGSSVADNIRTHNDTVTLEALISNQPIEMPKFGTNGASGSIQSAPVTVGGQTLNAQTWQFSQPFDRVSACDTKLRELQKAGQVLTVTSPARSVEKCAITRYKWDRSAQFGNALSLTMEFSAIRIANSRVVPVTAARRRAQQTQANRGAQPTAPAERSTLRALEQRVLAQFGGSGS